MNWIKRILKSLRGAQVLGVGINWEPGPPTEDDRKTAVELIRELGERRFSTENWDHLLPHYVFNSIRELRTNLRESYKRLPEESALEHPLRALLEVLSSATTLIEQREQEWLYGVFEQIKLPPGVEKPNHADRLGMQTKVKGAILGFIEQVSRHYKIKLHWKTEALIRDFKEAHPVN